MKHKNDSPSMDGAALAILTSRLEGIASKMANTLMKSGRSGVMNIARDFSCCIVSANDELVAAAESLPIHVLSGPDIMSAYLRETHPMPQAGDAFLHNSPYHGCSHAADHTLLVPVVDEAGVHRFTVLAKAHQADCGNSLPTTYLGSARDVYEEGALIFPMVQVQRGGQDIDDIVRMCRMRIRVPDQWHGDYLAMVGAARIGERELLALGREVGWDALDTYVRAYLDYSESRMVQALSALPEGGSRACTVHDALFDGMPPGGVAIEAIVNTAPREGRIEVDLRGNPDALPFGLNLSEACARTAAMIGVFNSIDPTVPKNAGSFRRIDILLRVGSVAGIPVHPSSCSVATTNIADRVANAVQTGIAGLGEGFGLAECGAVVTPSCGVVSGVDPGSGRPFINQVFLANGGGAGAPHADCWQTLGHVGNAGLCFMDSVELDELRQPLIVRRRQFVTDTEGAGRHTGARSIFVEFGPTVGAIEVAYVSDGTQNAPQGVRGGLAGARARQFKRQLDGTIETLKPGGQVRAEPGSTVLSYTCGGGGYGAPSERDAAAVARDVQEGYVSRSRAAEVYGVGVDADGGVDLEATARLRAAR